jgi:hypothetical protein
MLFRTGLPLAQGQSYGVRVIVQRDLNVEKARAALGGRVFATKTKSANCRFRIPVDWSLGAWRPHQKPVLKAVDEARFELLFGNQFRLHQGESPRTR